MSTWDDKPNDYEHALREIDRLRAALKDVDAVMDFTERNAIIEECAKVADELADDYGEKNYSRLAAAIRALKGDEK